MVAVLRIAADHQCERELGDSLLQQAQTGDLPSLKALQAQFLQVQSQPALVARQHNIADYDELLSGGLGKTAAPGR